MAIEYTLMVIVFRSALKLINLYVHDGNLFRPALKFFNVYAHACIGGIRSTRRVGTIASSG